MRRGTVSYLPINELTKFIIIIVLYAVTYLFDISEAEKINHAVNCSE